MRRGRRCRVIRTILRRRLVKAASTMIRRMRRRDRGALPQHGTQSETDDAEEQESGPDTKQTVPDVSSGGKTDRAYHQSGK